MMIVLYFALMASVYSYECHFNDALLTRSGGNNGGNNDGTEGAIDETKIHTSWKEERDVIPYYFTSYVPNTDRNTMRAAMKDISMKTCIKFRELNYNEKRPEHVLAIHSEETYKECSSGNVQWEPIGHRVIVLTIFGSNCNIGLMYHELFHVLGVAHTQNRPDRDRYININWQCIKGRTQEQTLNFQYQYTKLSCKDGNTHGTPYMCNSIMHYPDWAFTKVYPPYCKSITPKNGLKCNYGVVGSGNYPLPEDWDLIKRAHCGARTPRNNRC